MDQHVVDAGHLRNKNLLAYMNSCVENQTSGFSDTKPSSTRIIKKDIKEGPYKPQSSYTTLPWPGHMSGLKA
jgi:hypothetical protein